MNHFEQAVRDCMVPTAKLLEQTTEPLHRAMLFNFWRHVHLEGSGQFDRIVAPGTMGKLGDKEFVVVTARGGGYQPGTPRHGWDHREPWLRHALSTLGVTDAVFVDTELTLARESPAMIPLDLGAAEDQSLADALAAIDALVGPDVRTYQPVS